VRDASYRPEPDSRLFVWLTHLHNRHFMLADILVFILSALLSVLFTHGTLRPLREWVISYISLSIIIKLVSLYAAGVYHRFWRYASGYEFVRLLVAVVAGSLLLTLAAYLLALAGYLPAPPFSLLVMDFLMTAGGVTGTRYGLRLVESWLRFRNLSPSKRSFQRVLLVGASPMGAMMVTEMQENPQLGLIPVGFVDDELAGRGVRIRDAPVLGGVDQLEDFVRGYKIHQVFITWPNAPGKLVRQVMEVAQRNGAKVGIAPDVTQVLEGQITCNRIREVQLEDLLRRDPVPIDMSRVEAILLGRRVMVTGAGGSIGSELCRQVARCGPAELILLGHGENSLFSVSNELRQLFPNLTMHVVVADIRDTERMEQVFERYRPECVFHAAAHKHVPLMEENPEEAVTNNVWGTWNLLNLSGRYGVERFVLISTDKAVMPSSVMGATKRVAELLLREKARELGRPYVAVRFGNVLGSRGSVVPLFREQIARGGPITITHPEAERYFMTIPEAAQLVLQAAALGQGGEIFVLDMGTRVKIIDLALDLIRLSGLMPGRDIDIVYTGLRPGEKLREEIFIDSERHSRTAHERIFVSKEDLGAPADPVGLYQQVSELIKIARRGDPDAVRRKLREIVPEFSQEDTAQE